MKDFILLFHHHAIVYRDEEGVIHAPSFIGRWLNVLAEHVGEIRLLFYESDSLLPQQDDVIRRTNVTLWSLGPAGRTWDRIPRMRRLRAMCRLASESAHGLLIRGSTPRQMSVWKAVNVPHKAFLLVGSLLQSQPVLRFGFWTIYEQLMIRWRKGEVLKMGPEGLMLANSPILVDELRELGAQAVFVPTNTLSINEFPPLRVRELSTPRRILFCGRVVPEKGIKELLYALKEINKTQDCELDVVGPINDAFNKELIALTNALEISEKIKWHGRIPYGHELMKFYKNADVFVLSTYFEGFPHVIWEAAANSCPIITTNVGGIPALWKDGEHGTLIPAKDSSAIVRAIIALFNDPILHTRLVENAYRHAKEFTIEACALQLINALQEHGWELGANNH